MLYEVITIYKNREQRAQEVKKKIQIKTIEEEIESIQKNIKQNEDDLANPEIYSDYIIMNEKFV